MRARLERGGDRVTDLHLWQVGPGHLACIVALVSDAPRAPSTYKARLSDILALSHVTVEVEPCPAAPALAQGGLRLTPAKRDYVGFLDVVGRGVTSPPPSALHQSSQPGLASNEQLFERLRLRDAPLGGNLRRLPHHHTVGRLRIVVDLILRRHRIGRQFRIVVIVGTSREMPGSAPTYKRECNVRRTQTGGIRRSPGDVAVASSRRHPIGHLGLSCYIGFSALCRLRDQSYVVGSTQHSPVTALMRRFARTSRWRVFGQSWGMRP